MRLIELIVSGVPGTQGALRYPFQLGLNPWKQKGLFELPLLVETIANLFYPSSSEGRLLGPGKSQKAGMTFEARGQTYRLIRDFERRTLSLDQLETGTKDSFKEISKEPRFITETLRRSVRLPSQRVFRSLLCSRPGAYPSLFLEISAESLSAPRSKMSHQVAWAQLKKLREEQNQQERVMELELKINEAQSRGFEIDDALRRLEEPRKVVSRLQDELKPNQIFDKPGLVSALILSKLKEYPALIEKRASDLSSLDEKAQILVKQQALLPLRPVWKEGRVFVGAFLGVGSFIAAAFVRVWVWPFRIMLGWIVIGFVLVGWGLLKGIKRLERIDQLRKDLRSLETEKAGLEKRFDIDTSSIRKFFDEVNLTDVEEILERIKHQEMLHKEHAQALLELQRIEKEVKEVPLKAERNKLEKQVLSLQEQLRSIPPLSKDPHTIDADIRELEAILGAQSSPGDGLANPKGEEIDDLNLLLALAAETVDRPEAEVLAQALKGIHSNVAVMTENQFMGVETDMGKIISFRHRDGTHHPWKSTDPETSAALFFSVQFTLWQLLSVLNPLPVVVDYVSSPVSERLLNLTLAAARHVAKKLQVLVLGS